MSTFVMQFMHNIKSIAPEEARILSHVNRREATSYLPATAGLPRVCILLLMLLSLFPAKQSHAQLPSDDGSFLFIVRVDDILSRNQTFMPSSIIPFQEAAETAGVPVTWGVMPHRFLEANVNRGEMTRDLLVSVANGHEISLHGYIHLCQQCQSVSGAAFWGHEMYCTVLNRPLTYAQQERLIVDGLKILADSVGVRPTTFIPPGHVSDATTHQLLVDYDFHGIAIDKPVSLLQPNLFNVGTAEDFGWELTPANYVQRRTEALADIRNRGEAEGVYTLLLHDPFTRYGYRNGLLIDWFAEVIDSVKAEYRSHVEFVTLSEAASRLMAIDTGITAAETPSWLGLHQNFPNPFNPSTRITFTLAESATVRLQVFDVRGSLVATLADGHFAVGEHQVRFDGSGLSSGVYVYRLESGGFQLTRSMVLVK
ncbi:MAG: DUF2334 domain-containing protein [Balneolales bacterium]|nr:DUF2334 domain-containing protein [Balneolales bacterium]